MKLAIFLPNWVGDACMAIPTLRALRKGVSRNTTLLGIARPGPANLLSEQAWVNDWLIYKPRSQGPILNRRRLVAELRKQKCDAAILLTNSLSTAAIAALSGIPRRVGYARDGRSWLLTDRLDVSKQLGRPLPVPAIDYFLHLAEYFGCPSVDRNMELNVDPKYAAQAMALWNSVGFADHRPTIVINNHAANNAERLWPEDYVARLAMKLVRAHDVQVLLHCGPYESQSTNQLADRIDHPRIQSMGRANDLPLGLSLAVLKRAAVVVTTDSGARHLAVALDRPVISLFGAAKPYWTTTYNVPESILEAEPSCEVCASSTRTKNGVGEGCRCMTLIKPERVYTEILNRLQLSHRLQRLAPNSIDFAGDTSSYLPVLNLPFG